MFLPVYQNNLHYNSELKNIYQNTKIKGITYLNKDNDYYIVQTESKIYVLDLNFHEVTTLETSKIKEKDLSLVYRHNQIYYEELVMDKNKITYRYYDPISGQLDSQISLGGA